MFSVIFKHELSYWFKKPTFYIFFAIMAMMGCFLGAGAAGIFDSVSVGGVGDRIVNSPLRIFQTIGNASSILLFLLPSIIGVAIQRDFKSQMHSLLYSFPFKKSDYLFAKFFSAFVIVLLLALALVIFMFIGFRLPGTKQSLVGVFHLSAYVKTYMLELLPNMLFFGAIVFAVVLFTRNTIAGFITIIGYLLIDGFLASVALELDNQYLTSLISPSADAAIGYYTKYWTPDQRNNLLIPIGNLVIFNRLLWLGIATLIFGLSYRKFSFSQTAYQFKLFKKKSQRSVKNNFGGIIRISLPKVSYKYDVVEDIKKLWRLSSLEFKFIVKDFPFIAIILVGTIILVMIVFRVGINLGEVILPVTYEMLGLGTGAFTLFFAIVIFLYSGVLINKGQTYNANHLIDSTPTPNWVFLGSKFLGLIKVLYLLLTLILIVGIIRQTTQDYFNYELGLYCYHLYFLEIISYIIWTLLAFFVHTLLKNTYLGFFLLFVLYIAIPFLSQLGIEQAIYKFNNGYIPRYTDLNGFGFMVSFFKYKVYWLLFSLVLFILTALFWVRGLPSSFKERLQIFKSRLNAKNITAILALLIMFFSLGGYIYYENNICNEYLSAKHKEQLRVDFEKKYKKYDGMLQPRVVSVKVDFDMYPKTKAFKFAGKFTMVNKTNQPLDSLFVMLSEYPTEMNFDKNLSLVSKDTVFDVYIYTLDKPLQPMDSLKLDFVVKNKPKLPLRIDSPIKDNGTFVHNTDFIPAFGYSDSGELQDDKKREEYGLSKNTLKPYPTDTTALGNTYIARDSDWIDFETTVSTSEDQIAIAPGYLQKEWVKDGRRYFHYKMDSKILNFYAYNSGRYEVKKDKWNDVNLEIYYHKGHDLNVEDMMKGIKASLDYNTTYFSPYQHRQVRIIEFPRTKGNFAQSFPNTIPFSEGAAFLSINDKENKEGVNRTFAITVHELAHQWWAHQVIGADVKGSTMLSESLAEYVALKVLEHKKGKTAMREFLKESLDSYLTARSKETKQELPLMYTDGQAYVRYQKGALVFYALADYIGEEILNGALKKYVAKTKFQSPPYTTSLEMVEEISKVVPDSLKYVVKDMFETITLYRNNVVSVNYKKTDQGKYKVDIEFNVSKYRNDDQGKEYYEDDSIAYTSKNGILIKSLKLADYIDIGIFSEKEVNGEKQPVELYLKKHKIVKINNKLTIIVDQEPIEVGVDPYNKLIDTSSDDNRKKVD